MIGFRGFIYKMKECTGFSFSVCNQAKLCFKLSYKNMVHPIFGVILSPDI